MKQTTKKLTNRKLNALITKEKIRKTALSLIEEYGFGNVTIHDICERSGVATGSFYTHFKNKYDVIYSYYPDIDEYIKKIGTSENTDELCVEKVTAFFKVYADFFENTQVENVKLFFNVENKHFSNKDLHMYEILNSIIVNGQNNEELTKAISAEKITNWLFTAARGLIYDWCSQNGEFVLHEEMTKYIRVLMKSFIK